MDKRMAGDYEIIHSLELGGKEIVFGRYTKDDKESPKYMCGFCIANALFERFEDCVASNNYVNIIKEFGNRVVSQADLIEKENVCKSKAISKNMYDVDNSDSIVSKVVVFDENKLLPEYRSAQHQLFYVTGGGGAEANSLGSAVFAVDLFTGEKTRIERYQICGILKSEFIPDWAKQNLVDAFYNQVQDNTNDKTIYGKSFKSNVVDITNVSLVATFKKHIAWLIPDTRNLDLDNAEDIKRLVDVRCQCALYGFKECCNTKEYNNLLREIGGEVVRLSKQPVNVAR